MHLTWNTSFLHSLARAKTVNELHGLSFRVCHSQGWRSCTFSFLPDFVANTQNPFVCNPHFDEFTILSLDDFGTAAEMNSCSAPSELLGSIFFGWSGIVQVSRVSSCPLVWGRSGCLETQSLSDLVLWFPLLIHWSPSRTVESCRSGHIKLRKLLLPCCSGGTKQSIRYWRRGLGLPSRLFPPPTSEMSPTGTWICFTLGLWWQLSRLFNPLTLYVSGVVTLCVGLLWQFSFGSLYLLGCD